MVAKGLHPDGVTVAQAARLLVISRQAVDQRVQTGMATIPDAYPTQVLRSAIADEVAERLLEARKRVADLESSAKELGILGQRVGVRPQGVVTLHHSGDLPDEELFRASDDAPNDEPKSRSPIPAADVHAQEIDHLRDELEKERTGRALAEASIDRLRQDLRRANSAIDALKPEPDFDPDLRRIVEP